MKQKYNMKKNQEEKEKQKLQTLEPSIRWS